MMISAMSARPALSTLSPRAAATPQAETAAEPLDLSTIDTPAKAVLLPCLNPATQGVVLAGMVLSSMSGSPVTASLQMAFNDLTGDVNYKFNHEDLSQAVTAQGTIAGLPYSETWSLDQEKKTINMQAQLGETKVDLTLTPGQKGALVRGKAGNLPVLQIIAMEGNSGEKITTRGKLGTETFNGDMSIKEREDNGYDLTVTGKLGNAEISQQVSLAKQEQGLQMSGEGNLAGTSFSFTGSLGS